MFGIAVPLIARGGKWGVTVLTKMPREIPEGGRVKMTVTVENIGQAAGTFKLECTLGKFAPSDYAQGGPLYVGGPLQFYWGAGRTPNPGNLATYFLTPTGPGSRNITFELGPGQQTSLSFVSAPLAPITRYDGVKEYVLDAHWYLSVLVAEYELDWQLADLSCIKVVPAGVAQGRIVSTSYSVY